MNTGGKESQDERRPGRLAVVLFNLGGPDSPEAVQPFLKNLFMDPAILPMPAPVRAFVAWRISSRRAPVTREIYSHLGGKSPLLGLTLEQAKALEGELQGSGAAGEVRVFVAMRYWHPRAKEVVADVKAFEPDEVVLLPLYPQYSTTTSGSSINEWKEEAVARKLIVSTRSICCYPAEPGFIEAQKDLLAGALSDCPEGVRVRVLFSAHGLPKSIVDGGDPYQHQIERSVEAIVGALGQENLDHRICYQSRVTNREWLGPSIDDEVRQAGEDGVGVVVLPVAFVSEHSETLVELDIEYCKLAEDVGVPFYKRVATPGTHKAFIGGLAKQVLATITDQSSQAFGGARTCGAQFSNCPCMKEEING